MLGIVGAIAALILTTGLSAVTNFQQFLIDTDVTEEFLEERFVVEFVEFVATERNVNIFVRNIGLNAVTIVSISIVEITDQNEIQLPGDTITGDTIIQPRTRGTVTADISSSHCAVFADDSDCVLGKTYRITLVTDVGNIYSTETVPFRA